MLMDMGYFGNSTEDFSLKQKRTQAKDLTSWGLVFG